MKIKWLGHATFLIPSDNGTRIITDPYATTDDLRYESIDETAEIVTTSHGHGDHNNVAAVRGNTQVVRDKAEVKGIKIKGITSYHDESKGSKRGSNTIFCFDIDGVIVCHLGDLGHELSDKQVNELDKVDVLLIPVGCFFTITARAASEISRRINPRVIIPMHYKTEKLNFPIVGVDEFLQGKRNVTRLDASEVDFKAGELPAETRIIVLKHAK